MQELAFIHLEQICLMGSGLSQTVLLVQLSAKGKALDKDQIKADLTEQVLGINTQLEGHEKIAAVIVSDRNWNAENGLVTHTMKIKRAALEKHYSSHAEAVFALDAAVAMPAVFHELELKQSEVAVG